MSDYQQNWKKYRRLRTQSVLAWLGLFPVVAALLTVSSKQNIPQLGHTVIFVWIVLFCLTGFRVYLGRSLGAVNNLARPSAVSFLTFKNAPIVGRRETQTDLLPALSCANNRAVVKTYPSALPAPVISATPPEKSM
jgi:hypothetical protein